MRFVDFFLHPVLTEAPPEVLADIPHRLQMGCKSIKIFMMTEAFDAQFEGWQVTGRPVMTFNGQNGRMRLEPKMP